MRFTLALAQTQHPTDGDVPALVRARARQARALGADVVAFPESMQTPFELPAEEFVAASEPLGGPYSRAVDAVAAETGAWLVYSANERGPEGADGRAPRPFNTAVVTDAAGRRVAAYRKVHLFDVGELRESDKMSAGDRLLEPVDTPFCRLGLGICYDLRFPELARAAALAGCELLVYPAAWVAGPGKVDQWHTLLRARAIANGMYVAGVSRCDAGYVGRSLVVGPTGEVLAEAGGEEEVLTCLVDTDLVAAARAAVPSLAHRRPELY